MEAQISVPNKLRILAMRAINFPLLICGLALTTLSACTTSSRGRHSPLEAGPVLAMAPSTLPRRAFATNAAPTFDCAERATTVQDVICADTKLAALDREMSAAFRAALRDELVTGRSILLGFHQHWLQARTRECKLPVTRLGDALPDVTQTNCLAQTYRQHIDALASWPSPSARIKITAHPVSAYVSFRLVDDREPALCAAMAHRFDELLAAHGTPDPKRIAGVTELVGTHGGETNRDSGLVGGHNVAVNLLDAGLYASYQIRAKAASVDGRRVIDEKSLARWIQEQKNAGGRFNSFSSQTADYAAIDIFRLQGRDFALVAEPWAYYSPAAKGEAAYAGLYEIVNEQQGATVAPRCLYKLFLAPPIVGVLERLPALRGVIEALDAMTGGASALAANLSPSERMDRVALRGEALWTQLSLPLIAIDEANRPARAAALRRQHDAMLEAIFTWSERNAAAKQRYRELMPLLAPAHAELVAVFTASHGLNSGEAIAAADVVMMETIVHAAENLQHDGAVHATTISANYTSRYAPAPLPGALEQGRQFANLHSALINHAAPVVITDFISYEYGEAAQRRGGRGKKARSPSDETALMAAIDQPELVLQLLSAGADPNEANVFNYTPLMAAIAAGQTDSVTHLLNGGANVATATIAWDSTGAGWPDSERGAVSGRTALMNAAAIAKAEIIRLILRKSPLRSALDSDGHNACYFFGKNTVLSAAEIAELQPLICRPDTADRVVVKPMTLRQLLAAGARRLSRDEVVRLTADAVIQGENPDGKGSHELRFTIAGLIEGSTRTEHGEVLPIKGYWKVDNDAVVCGTSAVLIGGSGGKRIALPTVCSQFFELGDTRYVVKADAGDDEFVRVVPKAAPPVSDVKSK